MQLSDRITGLCVAGLGAAAAYAGSKLPPVPGQHVGPNVFPMVVGIGMVICGCLIAAGVGRVFEEQAEADLAAHGGETSTEEQSLSWQNGLMALIPPALLVFYVFAVERLGFLLTATVIVLTAARALGARWHLAVPLALIAPAFVHLAFAKLLRVPLPYGLLKYPW